MIDCIQCQLPVGSAHSGWVRCAGKQCAALASMRMAKNNMQHARVPVASCQGRYAHEFVVSVSVCSVCQYVHLRHLYILSVPRVSDQVVCSRRVNSRTCV